MPAMAAFSTVSCPGKKALGASASVLTLMTTVGGRGAVMTTKRGGGCVACLTMIPLQLLQRSARSLLLVLRGRWIFLQVTRPQRPSLPPPLRGTRQCAAAVAQCSLTRALARWVRFHSAPYSSRPHFSVTPRFVLEPQVTPPEPAVAPVAFLLHLFPRCGAAGQCLNSAPFLAHSLLPSRLVVELRQ